VGLSGGDMFDLLLFICLGLTAAGLDDWVLYKKIKKPTIKPTVTLTIIIGVRHNTALYRYSLE